MYWSILLVFTFVFSLLAPPVMPISEDEEKPVIVASQHDSSSLDRPIESDTEDAEPDDEEGEDDFIFGISSPDHLSLQTLTASNRCGPYQWPFFEVSSRPPRA